MAEGVFPGLPGDRPLPELLGVLAVLVLLVSAILSLSRVRTALRASFCALGVLLLVVATISARNIGEWGWLKHELNAYDAYVREYEALDGVIDSQQKARALYHRDERTFTFGDQEPKVEFVYLWWHNPIE
jgi:hypothetical protein